MPVFALVGAYLHGFIRDLLPGNCLPNAIINIENLTGTLRHYDSLVGYSTVSISSMIISLINNLK